MKKFTFFILFTFIFSTQIYGAIDVSVNGEKIDFAGQPPVLADGRTMVPVRAVFEHIGFDVDWHQETQSVILARTSQILIMRVGEPWFFLNGNACELDVPAQIIGGRTMLPIRAIMESVGYYVGWDRETSTVLILSEQPEFSQITIPDRELTADEIATWTYNYHAMGGATEFEREVIRLTNIERVAAGLNPVEEYQTLMLAARFKAQSMHDLDYFAHASPIYGHFANIARQVFNKPLRSMGENLSMGHLTPEDIVAAWMDSPTHRDNILTPNFTRIGVGVHNDRWVAQKFSG